MVRFTCPANPGGIIPASGPPGPGADAEAGSRDWAWDWDWAPGWAWGWGVRVPSGLAPRGPGVHPEQYVQVGPGPQRVHPAVQPGLTAARGPGCRRVRVLVKLVFRSCTVVRSDE